MNCIEYYRDEDGAPRARGENMAVLAQFLESDIQDDIETAKELLAVLNDDDPEDRENYDFVGNSFALSFAGEEVVLTCHALEDADEIHLRREMVRQSLQDWLAFISC